MGTPLMSADFEVLIAAKEIELNTLSQRMEELRQQFFWETTKFAAQWFENTAKEYVTKYPEITLNLTRERIAFMKALVSALSGNAKKIVTAALSNPEFWWHQKPQLHDDFSQYEVLGNDSVGNKFPQKIDNPVRRALGELGAVLSQFGFAVSTRASDKEGYPEFWFSYPEGEGKEARPYYPHLLVWSSEMQDTIRQYSSLFRRGIAIYNEIQKLKEEKKRRQASDLWDST